MAANFDHPEEWRLTTPRNNIPYKFVSLNGGFEEISGNVSVTVLIQSTDLLSFMQEMFPGYTFIDGILVPLYCTFGNTNLRVKHVTFKSFDDSVPIDPFNFDNTAPPDTYGPVLRCEISYEPPQAWLEIKASTTGEFLHATPTAVSWQALNADGTYDLSKPADPNRSDTVPCSILNPQTMWHVKWNKIPFSYFRDTVKPLLDLMLGTVNSKPFNLLYTTAPKTLLFAGYDFDYSYGWNSDLVDTPLVTLEMKFLQKSINWRSVLMYPDGTVMRVDDKGTYGQEGFAHGTGSPLYGPYSIKGHCDFWRPGAGWSRLLINGREVYDATDYTLLFGGQQINFNTYDGGSLI